MYAAANNTGKIIKNKQNKHSKGKKCDICILTSTVILRVCLSLWYIYE